MEHYVTVYIIGIVVRSMPQLLSFQPQLQVSQLQGQPDFWSTIHWIHSGFNGGIDRIGWYILQGWVMMGQYLRLRGPEILEVYRYTFRYTEFWPIPISEPFRRLGCQKNVPAQPSSVRQHHFSRFSSSRLPIKTLLLTRNDQVADGRGNASPTLICRVHGSSINSVNTPGSIGSFQWRLQHAQISNTKMAKHGKSAFDESIQTVRALQLCITI